MNFKQLKYVLILSQEGSFSKAAEALNISQPSLSQYIKKIEREVGIELFERSGGNVRLTDAGRVYINASRKILDIEHQMQNHFADISTYKSGTIIVGISPHRSIHLMPQAVKEFHHIYPGIKLVLDERSGHELIDAATRGEFDLCITTPPVNDKIFNRISLLKEELILAVPSESTLNKKLKGSSKAARHRRFPAVNIGYINHEDFISLGDYMPMKVITDDLCRIYNIDLNYTIEVRSNEALISMVTSGIGAAIIPSCLSNFYDKSGTITYYSFREDLPYREIIAIYRKDQYLSEPTKRLIEILRTIK